MNYTLVVLVSILVHIILNHEIFKNKIVEPGKAKVRKAFKWYIWTALIYYIADAAWGIVYELHMPLAVYINTVVYYLAMASTVVLMCRYVTAYLDLTAGFGKLVNLFGDLFALFEITVLFVNYKTHIFFLIGPDGTYTAGPVRYFALYMQIFLCVLVILETGTSLHKAQGEKKERYFTIFTFCLEMTGAILVQILYPMLPIYSIGLTLGITILHTFVNETEKEEQTKVLASMVDIFYSTHVIDLVNDTVEEFNAQHEVKEIVNHTNGAAKMMVDVMSATTVDEHKESALAFTDLTTLAERMKGKKTLSAQYIGHRTGWFLAMFIAIETDADERPTKVVYTTRIIDEEKKQEEKLIRESTTDELSGMLNRRAYEEAIYGSDNKAYGENFTYVSLDLNGLKVVNDTLGHAAGDELIEGACQCMKKCLGSYGKLFRTGGDEFAAFLMCDAKKVREILTDLDETMLNWKGKTVNSLSISYGYVSKHEMPGATIRELGEAADKRMYEAKAAYYSKKGFDRRGQQDAHKALCASYTKILKINITDDSYQIINVEASEKEAYGTLPDKISEWFRSFGEKGYVHPEDLEEYLRLTDIDSMREYFKHDKTTLNLFYRRKYGQEFKQVMMEIIPANDYSPENQNLYLYVKNIDR